MFDKITSRISKQCYGLNKQFVDPATVTLKCFKVRLTARAAQLGKLNECTRRASTPA